MPDHDIAVSVRGLSKSYTIAHNAPKHTTMGEALVHTLKSLRGTRAPSDLETFWALKDVEFDIHKGDVVGIIGRNGAGKSTLLKVLSRITEPTTGQIDIYGRVGSLLEVGTGFHPELTGRENVYMNGAILGMSKAEISKNFDAIVDFSGTEQFLDTPVKRYSSGMYVRLAFAVAAYLSSEILIVDEVLAVGDSEFQKKCLGKMKDVSRQDGRTVLFVSHNMAAIKNLCSRCILMQKGSVGQEGSAAQIVNAYLTNGAVGLAERRWPVAEAPGDDTCRLLSVRICQPPEVPCASINITQPFEIEIETESVHPVPHLGTALSIQSEDGQVILHTSDFMGRDKKTRQRGRSVSVCRFPAHTLNTGKYYLTASSDVPNVKVNFLEDAVLSWSVEPLAAEIAHYDTANWPGVIGPGIVQWSEAHSEALLV